MADFKIGNTIYVDNPMQRDYSFRLDAPMGENFDPSFNPALTPSKMLELGVFEGCYLNSCKKEYPKSWFVNAKLSDTPDVNCNYFEVKSRQPLQHWREKGWIINPDPRGWFEWYCRYYLGRRITGVDDKQISRWRAFKRHAAQVKANCYPNDLSCRPRQRQALLQWAYDPFI